MTGLKIVATGPIHPVAIPILEPFGEIVVARDASEDLLAPLMEDAIALVVRGDGKVGARVIDAGERLKVVARSGVGYNNVDVAAATRRKIPVVYTPGANSRAVAEAAVTFMLALCKRLLHFDRQIKAGNWQSRYGSAPGDLDGATLGIVGFGNIGRALAALVRPFNMTVLAHDPYAPREKADELAVELTDLDDLLARSDFISIHAPLTDETIGLISRERLKLVKRGSYLVNLARGGLIESLDALHEALQDGRLAGVGIDVFDPEPPDTSHPIFEHPDCLASPHVLAVSSGALTRIFRSMADDIAAVLNGRRPRFVVNPEVLE